MLTTSADLEVTDYQAEFLINIRIRMTLIIKSEEWKQKQVVISRVPNKNKRSAEREYKSKAAR